MSQNMKQLEEELQREELLRPFNSILNALLDVGFDSYSGYQGVRVELYNPLPDDLDVSQLKNLYGLKIKGLTIEMGYGPKNGVTKAFMYWVEDHSIHEYFQSAGGEGYIESKKWV